MHGDIQTQKGRKSTFRFHLRFVSVLFVQADVQLNQRAIWFFSCCLLLISIGNIMLWYIPFIWTVRELLRLETWKTSDFKISSFPLECHLLKFKMEAAQRFASTLPCKLATFGCVLFEHKKNEVEWTKPDYWRMEGPLYLEYLALVPLSYLEEKCMGGGGPI